MKARYRSLIEFTVKPGDERSFLEAFRASGMLTRPKNIKGYVDAELVRHGRTFAVIGWWETEEAYTSWQSVAQKEAPPDALKALANAIETTRRGRLFERVPHD